MNSADDIFDGVEALDEVAAIVLDQEGPEGLRQLLAHTVETGILCREDLLRAAERLEMAGLSEGAAIVMEEPRMRPLRLRLAPSIRRSIPAIIGTGIAAIEGISVPKRDIPNI